MRHRPCLPRRKQALDATDKELATELAQLEVAAA